jgi:hypothetical protein
MSIDLVKDYLKSWTYWMPRTQIRKERIYIISLHENRQGKDVANFRCTFDSFNPKRSKLVNKLGPENSLSKKEMHCKTMWHDTPIHVKAHNLHFSTLLQYIHQNPRYVIRFQEETCIYVSLTKCERLFVAETKNSRGKYSTDQRTCDFGLFGNMLVLD